MSTPDQQVRVFVSSTFRDMHAERDHLVTVVFPELRERIEMLGLEFFDVDLRWGVPAKDLNGETANSWEYCRQWIDRVEPLFVCILGQRYGWVPEVDDFKDEADRARQASVPRSITDLEVQHAVLNDRRKQRSYFYLRETPVPALSPDATAEERKAHEDFVDPPGLLDQLKALKTEIGQCGRPVRSYACRWTGQSFNDLDSFGRLVLDDLWSGVLRDSRFVSKEVWRRTLGTDPDTDPRYTDESQSVPRELWEQIVALAKPAPVLPLDAERQQMEAFAASRLKWFQGRDREIETLTVFLHATDEDAPRLAVVAAVPGQGKSALLAYLHKQLKSSPHFVITHFVGATERSATAHALVERLLGELDCSGIAWPSEQQEEGQEPKRDFNSLCLRLAQRLGDCAGERRIVILLDGLNQLTDGHDLQWLPNQLGPNLRVIVSCVEDAAAKPDSPERRVLQALSSRQPASLRLPLGPLTENDVRTIVVAYLEEYCHELDRAHLDTLCAITQARNPLYLMVMLNELRTLGGNDLNRIVPALIASMPQDHPDTVSLFRWVLQRLEVFGPEAVRWWCLCLAHGRVGMASHELVDLLDRKLGEAAASKALLIERGLRRYLQRRGGQLDFFHGQLRQAVMERYEPDAVEPSSRKDTEPQRKNTDGAEAIAPSSLKDAKAQSWSIYGTGHLHHEMAEYFTACARGDDPHKAWETEAVRGFSECVYHFTQAKDYDEAGKLLGDFPFLLHKIRVGLLEGVFEDYEIFRSAAPADDVAKLELQAAFFHENAHILRRSNDEWPAQKILLQLAIEHADDSPITIGAEQWLNDGKCNWPWLRRIQRVAHAGSSPCIAVFEGHTGLVSGVIETRDGRFLSWADDDSPAAVDYRLRLWERRGKPLAVLEGHTGKVLGAHETKDGHFLSWSDDHTLTLWDRDGKPVGILEGHTSAVERVLETRDGHFLSWSRYVDNTLRLWDRDGAAVAVLEGHTDTVVDVHETKDGHFLSWSDDHTLRLWASDGRGLVVLEGHTGRVLGAHETKDGHFLSWSADSTLRLWGCGGKLLAILAGHHKGALGVQETKDGRFLSRDSDGLILWDRDGRPLAILAGHTEGFETKDGRFLSWGDGDLFKKDRTLRLWDKDGKLHAVLEGHTAGVYGAHETQDGHFLSWSGDHTLRLWDRDGKPVGVLEGHTAPVRGVLETKDGHFLSWSWRPDNAMRLWDRDGRPLAILEGHTNVINNAHETQDGHFLSWSEDHTLRLWHKDGTPLAVCEGHTDDVSGALETTNGHFLSWSSTDIRLWDKDGKPVAVLAGHTAIVRGVLETKYGHFLSWSSDHTLRLWGRDGRPLAVLAGHTCSVVGAHETKDGHFLSWSEERTIRLWDCDGKPLDVLAGHTDEVEGALETKDGRFLSWSRDHTLRLWERDGRPLAILEGHTDVVHGAIETKDGRFLSLCRGTDPLRLWDRDGRSLAILAGHYGGVDGAIEAKDGRFLSWSPWSGDRTLRLWDKDGKALAVLEGHTSYVSGALETDVGRFLSWAWDQVRLWDKDGKPLAVLAGHTDMVVGVLQTKDGRFLSWAWDKLRLWDKDGRPLAVLEGHIGHVRKAIETKDGHFLSWSTDGTLRLWYRDGSPLAVLEGHAAEVAGAMETKDDHFLSWSKDHTLRLWNTDGKSPAGNEGHTMYVVGTLETIDGRFLSWSEDHTLRLWQEDGNPLSTLKGHTGGVEGVLETKDGRFFLSWARDCILRLWYTDGSPLAVLDAQYGHAEAIEGAIEMNDDHFLSWSDDRLVLWGKDGKRLGVLEEHDNEDAEGHLTLKKVSEEGRVHFLSWSDARVVLWDLMGNWVMTVPLNTAIRPIRWALKRIITKSDEEHAVLMTILRADGNAGHLTVSTEAKAHNIIWHGESKCTVRRLKPDGCAILTQDNGEVCFLRVYHGNRPISIKQLEEIYRVVVEE